MFFGKKRWICEEVEKMLLALHPAYDIRVRIKIDGKTVNFPFRDNEGKMFVDPYRRDVVGVDVDYMREGYPIETFYVGKDGLAEWSVPYVRERLDNYVSHFPKMSWTTTLKRLADMREELRTAVCNSMEIDFTRFDGDSSSSIGVSFNCLSLEQRRRVCDVICNLDSDAISIQADFLIDHADENRIYATLDELALYDAKKDAETYGCGEDGLGF